MSKIWIVWIARLFMGLLTASCGQLGVNPTLTPTPTPSPTAIPSPTPEPSPTPKPAPTTISTTLACADIMQALKEGGSAWSEFSESSIGAPIRFTGYVFQIDFGNDLLSIASDDCELEIWLKGIPHSTVIFTSFTQQVEGTGTIESYPDLIYMDEILVVVDPNTLWIQ